MKQSNRNNDTLDTVGKLLILLTILILLVFVEANAQSGYKFGIKVGMNLTQLTLNSIQRESSKFELSTPVTAGYTYGVVFHLGLNDNIAIETGVELNKRNFSYRVAKENKILKHTSYVYGWEFPLIVAHRKQIITTKKPDRSIYLKKYVGTSFSILHPYEKDGTITQASESYEYSLKVSPRFGQSFLIGIAFELDSKWSQGVYSLGLSYHYNFIDLIHNDFTANSIHGITKATGRSNGSYTAITFTCLLPQ